MIEEGPTWFATKPVVARRATVPEISRFLGIVIRMHFREHGPPHFHASYQGREAVILIEPLVVWRGALSPRALGLVMEWAARHRMELIQNWELARSGQQPVPIRPLE